MWVIFGCGGNRDALKRPLMGDVARQWAHKIIITDDNPREEDPFLIRKQIFKTMPHRSGDSPSGRSHPHSHKIP